eukprot:TRINITY_DN2414_c0_g1_i1.p1 TRINITY_DN2414_c0_g1~~TRINITY_DN2414_c0_g1_i1.p1  ORF type:complete len:614 (+),score=174.83 TRINITY_DN2414_c0_g1_i1:56-1897(+)
MEGDSASSSSSSQPSPQVPAPKGKDTSHLAVQDLATLDVNTLTPLSHEVISRQATINIGTIGHVAHGKSTVVKAISGVQTVRFKNELERNITIKLGYANAKVFKCDNPECPRPQCYRSYGSNKEDKPLCERTGCGFRMSLMRHVSFVDCPGHDILMATMLNGAAVMDAALLLIAGNESCPQPQTSEHLAAIEIMKLKHIIILQNKIDLVKEAAAMEQHDQILKFIEGTVAENAPIIPISAQMKYNIDVICEMIIKKIPIPVRDFTSSPRLIVIRSFDVNKPGAEVDDLKGGVAGGSIVKGVLRLNDEIEVRPGIVTKDAEGNIRCTPIFSKIVTLFAEENDLKYAVPGGLIGVGTKIDPTLCRADRPISAQMKYNIDVICEMIIKKIPIPVRDFTSSPRLIVIRSFDVNKPGAEVDDLKGGVAGGSIVKGVLRLNDEIEVRPGIVTKDAEGNIRCTPIFSKIVTLFAEENDLKYAVPGGLIGVGTKIDPTLCRADRLVGQVLGEVGKLPSIFTELEINFFLLRRLLGVKAEGDKQSKVQKLVKGEVLMVNIGSTSTGGRILAVKQDLAKIVLISPVCTQEGEKIALSRRVEKHWRLIGWGQIMRGSTIPSASS